MHVSVLHHTVGLQYSIMPRGKSDNDQTDAQSFEVHFHLFANGLEMTFRSR